MGFVKTFLAGFMVYKGWDTFREGNRIADALANRDIHSSGLIWWDVTPDFVLSFCNHD